MTSLALPVLDLRLPEPGPAARRDVHDARRARRVRGGQRGRSLALVRDTAPPVLRRAEAVDAAAVHALLDGFVGRGLLLPRTRDQVSRTIGDFVVAVAGDRVVGSVALRPYSADLAEVSALAVAGPFQGSGVGRRLVEAAVAEARARGLRRLFALTMEAAFFRRLGFTVASIGEFPQKVATDCDTCPRRLGCREITVALTL